MSTAPDDAVSEESSASPRLALLLAATMFVLVVDTSLMNVSISDAGFGQPVSPLCHTGHP
jgi:hypothetical protein